MFLHLLLEPAARTGDLPGRPHRVHGVGGSALLNVFEEEIPSGRRSRSGWLLTGLLLCSALLALVTYLQGRGVAGT